MKRLVTFAAVGALALAASTGAALAAGESCNTAIVIKPGITPGDLGGGSSQWFSFEPGTTADFGVDTNFGGTEFDTVLSVYDSCGSSPIAQDEGVFPDRKAFVNVPMVAGQTYFIEVSKLAGTGTAFELGVSELGNGGGCGSAGTGGCFIDNGSPFCDDSCGGLPCPGCCDTVCAIDSFCCAVAWDSICAGEAQTLCTVVPVDLQSIDIERR